MITKFSVQLQKLVKHIGAKIELPKFCSEENNGLVVGGVAVDDQHRIFTVAMCEHEIRVKLLGKEVIGNFNEWVVTKDSIEGEYNYPYYTDPWY